MKQVSNVILSNDDGPNSPLFRPFLRAILGIHNLRPVFAIPDSERSWISQALSLRKNICGTQSDIEGVSGYLLDSTPAECASIAIEHLFKEQADFFLSGINLGTNAGMAFYHNSGTLGAARQASLYGVCSVALSVYLPSEIFESWKKQDQQKLGELESDWNRIANCAAKVFDTLKSFEQIQKSDLLSINFPWDCSDDSHCRITRLARVGYSRLFRETQKDVFTLSPDINCLTEEMPIKNPTLDQLSKIPSDIQTIKDNQISITPINLDSPVADWNSWLALEEQLAKRR